MPKVSVTVFDLDGTDTRVRLTGAKSDARAGAVSAAQQSNDVTVSITGAAVTHGAGTLNAFGQGTPGTLGFPRIATILVSAAHQISKDTADSRYQRQGLALCDVAIVNMNPDIIGTTTTPGGQMNRTDIVDELLGLNANLQIFDYHNVNETGNAAGSWNDSDTSSYKCYNENGPAGAELFWDSHGTATVDGNAESLSDLQSDDRGPFTGTGQPVNDWWARKGNGEKKATFTGSGVPPAVNIAIDYVQADANGQYYPDWRADNIGGPTRVDPFVAGGQGVGSGGINIFQDVCEEKPRSDQFDFNGDGQNDDARTYYNAHDATNRDPATDGGAAVLGLQSAAAYRRGQRLHVDHMKSKYPGIQIIGNLSTWVPNTNSTSGSPSGDVQPEWQTTTGTSYPTYSSPTPRSTILDGGLWESLSGNINDVGFPYTGVTAQGTLNGQGFPGTTFGFWYAYNQYRYGVEVCSGNKYSIADFHIASLDRIATIGGQPAYDWVPSSSMAATAYGLMRWGLCMTLMSDGYFAPTGIDVSAQTGAAGRFRMTPIFDEFGTINTATTGLSRGWLGQPLSGTVTSVIAGSQHHGIMFREFENGCALVNTSKTQNVTVPIATLGAGVYRRIQGVQDTSTNNGATVSSNFVLGPIDGLVLVRI